MWFLSQLPLHAAAIVRAGGIDPLLRLLLMQVGRHAAVGVPAAGTLLNLINVTELLPLFCDPRVLALWQEAMGRNPPLPAAALLYLCDGLLLLVNCML